MLCNSTNSTCFGDDNRVFILLIFYGSYADTLQLAIETMISSIPQGYSSFSCRSQFVHLATVWVESEQLTPLPSKRYPEQREIPDWILEHFIIFYHCHATLVLIDYYLLWIFLFTTPMVNKLW